VFRLNSETRQRQRTETERQRQRQTRTETDKTEMRQVRNKTEDRTSEDRQTSRQNLRQDKGEGLERRGSNILTALGMVRRRHDGKVP
jgi:hypothetical protein